LPDFRVILEEYVESRIQRQGLYKLGVKYETPGTVYRTSAVVR